VEAKLNPDAGSALLRGLLLLERIAQSDHALSLAELAQAVDLPKPTVHRMLRQLSAHGFVAQAPGDRRYMVSRRLSRLAVATMQRGAVHADRHAILERLVAEVGETCNLTMLDGTEVVYVDRVESHWPLQMTLQAGSRVPIHCTASGKLLFALLPARTRQRLLRTLKLQRHTPGTLTDPVALDAELTRIREARVGTDNQEFLEGLVATAVPVLDSQGQVIAALAMHGPVGRLSLARALSLVPQLRAAATAMGEALAPA